jgi:hypothetical protein
MLLAKDLDQAERASILRLLAEEEAKEPPPIEVPVREPEVC